MAKKTGPRQKHRRTTMLPATAMEELSLPDDKERAALLTLLKDAEAQIKSGSYTDYEPKTFRDRLVRIYRDKKR